uniref:Hermansky-Pudlak syndrome 5 protein homolog n=1 Tax=Leptobrachium leishanense TaxID=445787 RepID=A0A8C5MIN8_9ANUR
MMAAAVAPESCSHVLAEFDSLDPLLSALRLDSNRLKCTCLAVSRKWLALGSSGGGLNLIQRESWKQRLILTHKEGAISCVACCPHDEDYVAVATSQGIVVVWELNQERRGKPERIYVSTEHRGRKVTTLCWDNSILRVFVGDHVGKVTAIKLNSSKQGKAAAAFMMFPVQIITTVDSRVVQLDYLDGRLLISSLVRSYLCDTEREKFWKIGNKERDGEYGACFFPSGRNPAGQQPLIYCARPGSRMWEVNFEGEVQSTHQFKQLLSSPPLPIINSRSDPQCCCTPGPPQSLAFAKLLYISEHNVVTWTDRGIYIFMPQNVQVLLWSEVRDIRDIAVHKNELFCLLADGKVSHLFLLPVERCIDRLIKRNCWGSAARVCHAFQNVIASSRVRKVLPVDRLEYLKAQLDLVAQHEVIAQLEEVISKLEPSDSACSSRRSSISSHESFNVLDCGIYRVISRRNSQSDEDSGSLHSQTLSEDERLREVFLQPDEEPAEMDNVSHASVTADSDRSEPLLPFNISLPFRSTSPRLSLQAVRESVSSFVKKTSDRIGSLHMSPDARPRYDTREERAQEEAAAVAMPAQDAQPETEPARPSEEEIQLEALRTATAKAMCILQDSQVLFSTDSVESALLEWIQYAEKVFNGEKPSESRSCQDQSNLRNPDEVRQEIQPSSDLEETTPAVQSMAEDPGAGDPLLLHETSQEDKPPFRTCTPCDMSEPLRRDVSQLITLCLEFGIFSEDPLDPAPTERDARACRFIRDYFFLLDLKGLKRSIVSRYSNSVEVWNTYLEGLKERTGGSAVALAMEKEDLVTSIQILCRAEPRDSPFLLAHASTIYERFGERSVRLFIKFYPSLLPVDVMQLCQANPEHFLGYLDNLIKAKPEEQRPSFLQTLLQPESLKLEWLLLALKHDAPQTHNTQDAAGNPRLRSHLYTWGYGTLITLLIKLPADFQTKQDLLSACKASGYWQGFLSLCLELERRSEALTHIVYLDDLDLLDESNGLLPETADEWKLLLNLAKTCHVDHDHRSTENGHSVTNGHSDWSNCVSVENVALMLAKVVGPDRAWPYLQDWGLTDSLSERYTKVCAVMKVAENRQRALIQSMLERCERFLWSQQV